jgi:exopolysaccharide biosynthesis polyprenyl glycosylphosphotransferase
MYTSGSLPQRAKANSMTRLWATIIERGWTRWLIIGLDVLLIQLAFFTAWYLRYEVELGGNVEFQNFSPYSRYLPTVIALTLMMVFNLNLAGLYKPQRATTWFDEVYGIINATTTSVLLIVVFFFFYQFYSFSRLVFAYSAALLVLYLSLARLGWRFWWSVLRKAGVGVTRIIIVGAGEGGRALMRHVVAQPELGYQVQGFVDDDPERQKDIGRLRALGNTADIPRLVRELAIDKVIITLPWNAQRKTLDIIQACQKLGVEFRIVPDLFQVSLTQVSFDEIKGVPLIGLAEPSLKGVNFAYKRAFDIAVSVLVLIPMAPIIALVALLIKLDSPGPVIFKQKRVGRGGKLFEVFKFRSMRTGAETEIEQLQEHNEADGPLFKIRNDPRVTRFGRFLRKSSLDEFPQMWNVLKGDMSLIGPRPALPDEVAQYQEWHRKRLEAPPGLTGLWQVSGRSDTTFDEMMLLDIFYVERWSPMLDLMILLRTIPTVLFQRGAY